MAKKLPVVVSAAQTISNKRFTYYDVAHNLSNAGQHLDADVVNELGDLMDKMATALYEGEGEQLQKMFIVLSELNKEV